MSILWRPELSFWNAWPGGKDGLLTCDEAIADDQMRTAQVRLLGALDEIHGVIRRPEKWNAKI